MPFLSNLDTRVYKEGEFFLLNPFGFEFVLKGHRYQLWTPRRFITDFGSMPWLIQCIPGFDVNGPSRFASIPHDYLYSSNGDVVLIVVDIATGVPLGQVRKQFTRTECDEIFRLALLDIGGDEFTKDLIEHRYTKAQAALFYTGVQLGGLYYWNKRRDGICHDYDFAPKEMLR